MEADAGTVNSITIKRAKQRSSSRTPLASQEEEK
jgi:hypothetical protein